MLSVPCMWMYGTGTALQEAGPSAPFYSVVVWCGAGWFDTYHSLSLPQFSTHTLSNTEYL